MLLLTSILLFANVLIRVGNPPLFPRTFAGFPFLQMPVRLARGRG